MWKILLTIGLLLVLANIGYSLYELIIQIQQKDTVKDSWGWIFLRVLLFLGSLDLLWKLYKNGLSKL
jgi:uncharacterized membrane protein YqjE